MIDRIVNSIEIQTEFSRRLLEEWLPTYCNDPKRKYSIDGYKQISNKVTALDARDFMRALDKKIVTDTGGGRFRMPQSKATEVIFWEGSKTTIPRPITLWGKLGKTRDTPHIYVVSTLSSQK